MLEVILGLGSNICEPITQLKTAINNLEKYFKIIKISKIYQSVSLLKDNQDDYYNLALIMETNKSPEDVLTIIKRIEKSMGRVKNKKWGERIIDIDIIDYNREIIKYNNLEIPHNQMIYRSFVLYPVLDIMPNYTHPVLNLSIKEMINNLTDDYNIKECKGRAF